MKHILPPIQSFSGKKVLVIGDLMVDRWTEGVIERLSPEAPVLVLQKKDEKVALGGASNVAHNIKALGGEPILIGVVGNDYAGSVLLKMLHNAEISTQGIIVDPTRPTTEKHRFTTSSSQHLLRLDVEDTSLVSTAVEESLLEAISKLITHVDSIVCSDYAKGVFTPKIAQHAIKTSKKLQKKCVADFKPTNMPHFKGAAVITPNLKEAREMAKFDDLKIVGSTLKKLLNSDVIVTRGAGGISLFVTENEKLSCYHEPSKAAQVVDVSGAGDTVTAVVALCLAANIDLIETIKLANAAGGVVVQKERTATLSQEELIAAFVTKGFVNDVAIVPKVWGYEKWLENNEKYCCKILSLKKNHQCSLHYHKNKDETFLVTKGHVRLEVGDVVHHLHVGAFVRIEPTQTHRFTGIEDSEMIEVSTHHEESDSYRLEQSRRIEQY